LKAVHHIVVSSAETRRTFNSGFDTGNLHRPIEVYGPTHFIDISDGGEGAAPGDASRTRTRTPSTELRDMFLERRHRSVLSLPYFEWDPLKGSAEKKAYVAAKLRAVGVIIPASTTDVTK
jgi:hypothetical protein